MQFSYGYKERARYKETQDLAHWGKEGIFDGSSAPALVPALWSPDA
jgi:hypothetical protein